MHYDERNELLLNYYYFIFIIINNIIIIYDYNMSLGEMQHGKMQHFRQKVMINKKSKIIKIN